MKTRSTVLAFGRQCFALSLMLALLCGGSVMRAQGFEKRIGGPKDDFGQAILQTKDHGYIEVGSTRGIAGDDNDFDIFVVRTDVDGTTVWTRQHDDGFTEQAEDVLQLNEDNYLVLGYRQETPTSSEETYLLRLDRFGRVTASFSYGEAGVDERGRQLIALPNEEFLLTGYRSLPATGRREIVITKVNLAGEQLFRAVLNDGFSSEGFGALVNPDGSLVVAGTVRATATASEDIVLYGLTADGTTAWTRSYGTDGADETLENIIRTSDDNLVFVGTTENRNKALIAKADLNGDTLWYHEIDAGPLDDILYSVIEDDNGASLVAVGQTVPTPADLDVLMVKVRSTDGLIEWQRRLGDENTLDVGEDLAETLDGGYALAGFSARSDGVLGNELVLYKTDDLGGLQTNYLVGKVYHARMTDCGAYQDGDLGLSGWIVRASSESATFFGSTDSLGNYELRVDPGVYDVSLLQKNDRWEICNAGPLAIDLTEAYDSVTQAFPLRPAIDCPLLEVTMSATPAVRCENQRLTVRYSNTGTATATGSSVEVTLDDHLELVAATPAPNEQNEQTLVFNTGDLMPSTEGVIELTVRVACTDVVSGQALQTRAEIFPRVECAPISADWDGSSIVVTSRCDRMEGLTFSVTNVGENIMTQTSSYVVVEDIVLFREGIVPILMPGQTEEINIGLTDDEETGTYRLIAEQSENHPGSQFPTAVAEGCPTNGDNGFTTGFVSQFPDNDGDLNLDILTQEIVALEPGAEIQLTAYPQGYREEIIIPKTDIEYTVFFALPTNDSFERVVIRDTLPEPLDFNSLEMGAASHPYDFVLYQDGILKITFDSIRIFSGGSTGEADAATRRGYVSYRLSQKPNLTEGTVIRNRAAVYFDYETPVLSPETRHVIGCANLFSSEGCLLTSTTEGDTPDTNGAAITVSPNPVGERATVRLPGVSDLQREFEFTLFDGLGRVVLRDGFRGDQFEFLRPKVASGPYFFRVTQRGMLVGSGHLTLR